jgi:hypothetical protein
VVSCGLGLDDQSLVRLGDVEGVRLVEATHPSLSLRGLENRLVPRPPYMTGYVLLLLLMKIV